LPTLLFVHGDFGDGFDTWSQTAELLAERSRAVIIDRPGFGTLIAAGERFTIAGDASEILRAADDMRLEMFHLIGHSYGGLVALEMAVSSPRAVRSLHLIEPPLFDLLRDVAGVQHLDRRAREIQRAYEEAGDESTTAAFFAMIGAEHVAARLRGTPDWQRLSSYAARFARSEPAGAYPKSALNRLAPSLPIALYTGGRSHPALRGLVTALAERIPQARVTDVADAGHAVQMSGTAFTEPLMALIEEVESARLPDDLSASGDPTRE
jgi:pimeloyl-ACP methyl ester carboxylesterase